MTVANASGQHTMLTTFRICIKKETANAAQFLVSATDLHLLFAKQMQNREKLRRQRARTLIFSCVFTCIVLDTY